MDEGNNSTIQEESGKSVDGRQEPSGSEPAKPLFRIKSIAPYVGEPVVQQNCIR